MQELQAKINERDYALTAAALEGLDLISVGPNQFHLIKDGVTHHCRLLAQDLSRKEFILEVNGRELTVAIKDEVDQLVDRLGLSVAAAAKSNDIFAPMPGLVLDIMVKEGQEIEAGTPLLILEAMKMENVLKAEGDGVVKSIAVKQGKAVDKRQLLVEIE